MIRRRTIAVVTTSRADYAGYRPVLRAIVADPALELRMIVAGSHLTEGTISAIEDDGFRVDERIEFQPESDCPAGIAASMGMITAGFARAYANRRPDILLALGDRFEMHSAVVAGLPFTLAVAHIHGGELTEGAIDDALRHSITKMSHLHFVAMEESRRRVIAMGEEPWRVVVSGAPRLDEVQSCRWLTRAELETRYRLALREPIVLVTYHPVTLEFERTAEQMSELLAALDGVTGSIVLTAPNADTSRNTIAGMLQEFVARKPNASFVGTFGPDGYFSLLKHAAVMVGNSSSGLIEAPSFRLPVVNVGSRQDGRARARNVIDVECMRAPIASAIARALSSDFRSRLSDLVNPYGDGHAAARIVGVLKSVELNDALVRKRFYDASPAPALLH